MDNTVPLPTPKQNWALFLDVDGTLIEIAETPDRVSPDDRLPEILSALSRGLDGAVALVSGRPIAVLDRLVAPLRLPAAGLHGLERRDAAGTMSAPVAAPDALDEARRAIRDFAAAHIGVLVEDKGLTVALHYRQTPDLGAQAIRLGRSLVDRLGDRLILQKGKMVVEIRPRGPDKGSVIGAFMAEPPFAGRVPVFIGDDVTDEAGFDVVNRLGGHSIRVGGDGPTAAHCRIASVKDLLSWLDLLRTVLAPPAIKTTQDKP